MELMAMGDPPVVSVNVDAVIVLLFISSLKVALTIVLTSALSEFCGGKTAEIAAGSEGSVPGDAGTNEPDESPSQPGGTVVIKPSIKKQATNKRRFLSDILIGAMRDS